MTLFCVCRGVLDERGFAFIPKEMIIRSVLDLLNLSYLCRFQMEISHVNILEAR